MKILAIKNKVWRLLGRRSRQKPAAANASSPSIQNAGNTQAPSMISTNHTSNYGQAFSEEVLEQLLRDPQIVDMITVPKTPTGLPLRPERPVCFFYDAYGLCQKGPACLYDHPYPYNPSQHRVVATREGQINRRY
ncbi:uncharacterized protein LOC109836706 isoform X1 [Asparagus officinalis]|uniref:uncharacterized protein LOC109836706 isoform X1 n=1 Tax=Asparagus officinalis TaxID=4686 RepID=UPI00098E433A|nr:uncharacterized protein LOC109836706 isoform X1 [Asparagus officinalis]